MKPVYRVLSALLVSQTMTLSAVAQDQEPERIRFAGGELTITETPDYEKVLAFDGRELARDYFVFFDGIADVGGTEVAFVYVGPGGNACAPSVVMVWESDDAEVTSQMTEEDCATPSPAISDTSVFFIPYLLPGDQADVTSWAPGQGISLHGRISYAPQPETSWSTFDPASIGHPMDVFKNADIYAASQDLLGDELDDVAIGLGTAGKPDISADGMLSARGCVPHACGTSDSFVVIDPANQTVYFSQQGEPVRFWPDRASWPTSVSALVPNDF